MMSRKLIKILLVTSAIVGIWVAGCRKEQQAEKVVVRLPGTQVLRFDILDWSPQVPYLQGTLLEGLYGYNRELEVVPKVAQSVKISPDQKRWVFHLDTTKRWSNGDPVIAEDFVASWRRFLTPEASTAAVWASFLKYVVNNEACKMGIVPVDSLGIRALDRSTIEVRLETGVDIRPLLVLPSAMPLHRDSLEKHGSQWWLPKNFVGNGPYILVDFVIDNRFVLEKNPHYVGEVGNVDRFEVKSGGLLSQVQNYQSGALDVAHVTGLGNYRYLTQSDHLKNELREQQEFGYYGYQIARTVNPLMHDARIRRALALAINKKKIAESVMGGRVVPTQWYGPPDDSLLQGIKGIPYDPNEARRLLTECGYTKERPEIFVFAPPPNDPRGWAPLAEQLQVMWSEVGFNVTLRSYEENRLNQYVWGTGFYRGEQYERPGMTIYEGKILWKDPKMMLRLAEHTWEAHNFPYALKKKLKELDIEARQFSQYKLGESLDEEDWFKLDSLNRELIALRRNILAQEPSPFLRNQIAVPNIHALYAQVRKNWDEESNELRRKKWLEARNLLYTAQVKYLKYSENQENHAALRLIAELEYASGEKANQLVRQLQEESLREGWIIPLYSEKLVYLIQPWLKDEVLNKFGPWLCLFNLQYLNVDLEAYRAARQR